MALLSEQDKQTVRKHLADIKNPVKLLFFTQTIGGPETALIARQILDELVDLNEQVTLEEVNVVLDREKAAQYAVDRVPAIALLKGEEDTRIRFFGAPAGYEFMSLIEAVLLAGGDDSGLSEKSREQLRRLESPVDIQVFVTPT